MNIFVSFVEKQGIIYVMIFLFLCGFILKTLCSLCYDEVINKIDYLQLKTNKVAGEIIKNYETDLKLGKNIRNTEVYVKTELHKWRKFGLVVEKMSSIGDGFGKMCFVVGALTDICLLSVQKVRDLFGSNYMNNVYIYGALSVVLLLLLKMWSNFLSIDYKKNLIKDEIINYIDNHPSYVKLNADRQQAEKKDNHFLENYLQKEQEMNEIYREVSKSSINNSLEKDTIYNNVNSTLYNNSKKDTQSNLKNNKNKTIDTISAVNANNIKYDKSYKNSKNIRNYEDYKEQKEYKDRKDNRPNSQIAKDDDKNLLISEVLDEFLS